MAKLDPSTAALIESAPATKLVALLRAIVTNKMWSMSVEELRDILREEVRCGELSNNAVIEGLRDSSPLDPSLKGNDDNGNTP